MRADVATVVARVVAMVACALPADAASGKINSFTTSSSGNIAFTVPNLTNAALAGSQSYAYTLKFARRRCKARSRSPRR